MRPSLLLLVIGLLATEFAWSAEPGHQEKPLADRSAVVGETTALDRSPGTDSNDDPQEDPFGADKGEMDPKSPGTIRIAGEKLRTWKGAFDSSIEARLVGLSGATVLLGIEGEVVAFPLAWFTNEHRAYVRAALRACGQERLFPGVADPEDESAGLRLSRQEWRKRLEQWRRDVFLSRNITAQAAARQHLRNVRDPNAMEFLSDLATRDSRAVNRFPRS